jgi:pyrroloquinoline quinone biosynthesis protein B
VLPEPRQVYVFDATPDLREQLDLLEDVRQPPTDKVDRSPIDGVFLTHAHIGHYLGLAFFGYEAVNTSSLPVYCTPNMAEFLRSSGPWSLLVERSNILIRELAPGNPIQLPGQVSVAAIASPHRDEYSDTVGFVIQGPRARLLYLPDTDAWSDWDIPLAELVADLDFALLDGTFFSIDELPGRSITSIGHPLISDSMDRLQSTVSEGRTRVLFIHLNHSNPALDSAGEARREIRTRGFTVASEGQEFPI